MQHEEVTASETTEPDYKALYEQAKADAEKWKNLSRKNESKAKTNSEAAASLETTQERIDLLLDDIKTMSAENDQLRAAAERNEAVRKVAAQKRLPEHVVESFTGTDEETLMAQATTVLRAIPAYPIRQDNGGGVYMPRRSNAEVFADVVGRSITPRSF